jgi:hypothetical protein
VSHTVAWVTSEPGGPYVRVKASTFTAPSTPVYRGASAPRAASAVKYAPYAPEPAPMSRMEAEPT